MRSKAKCHPDREHCAKGLCKSCYQKQWKRRNPKKIKLYNLKSRAKNKDKPEFKEVVKRRAALWRKENPKKVEAKKLERRTCPILKARSRKLSKLWRDNNPERLKETELIRRLKKFNLTKEDYENRKKKGCEICGSLISLCLDHNHKTGKFRGILCLNCNLSLGKFGDNLEGIERVVSYLKKQVILYNSKGERYDKGMVKKILEEKEDEEVPSRD